VPKTGDQGMSRALRLMKKSVKEGATEKYPSGFGYALNVLDGNKSRVLFGDRETARMKKNYKAQQDFDKKYGK